MVWAAAKHMLMCSDITDTRHQRQMALRTTTLNSVLAIKAVEGQDQRRKKERHKEQLFSNEEGVAIIATHMGTRN